MSFELEKIHEVFTPRRDDVNDLMYAHRPKHESSLARALSRNTHMLIYGDSGNGKSWLYRKVLDEKGMPYVSANCANANRIGSLTNEICTSIIEPGALTKIKISEDKAAEVNAYFARGNLSTASEYKVEQEEPLLKAFQALSESNRNKKCIVVLDNLEAIFSDKELMQELANIIILLDDPKYGKFNIALLLVGTPSGVLEYFRSTVNVDSVANRIKEVRKVDSLSQDQTRHIVSTGFSELGVDLEKGELEYISAHVVHVTIGIAQRIHEYCECLAYAISENDWQFEQSLLRKTNREWLEEGLRHSYQVVEQCMNSRETRIGRRNQVLYCIGQITAHQFDSKRVDRILRKEFPNTIPKSSTGVGAILSAMSNGDGALLKRNDKSNTYSMRDPRHLMCIRAILLKDESTEAVKRRKFRNS